MWKAGGNATATLYELNESELFHRLKQLALCFIAMQYMVQNLAIKV
ncbi:hypothetical protein [Prevotella aurantiaca]